jgi:hypothetical protein
MPKQQNLPVRPSPAPGKYREQYGVIVICRDERDQEAIFNRLKSLGRPIRVVTT